MLKAEKETVFLSEVWEKGTTQSPSLSAQEGAKSSFPLRWPPNIQNSF